MILLLCAIEKDTAIIVTRVKCTRSTLLAKSFVQLYITNKKVVFIDSPQISSIDNDQRNVDKSFISGASHIGIPMFHQNTRRSTL